MANEMESIVVKAEPQGLDETSQGFQQMQDDLEEAEGQMADTTDQFADLSERWQGVMGSLVAGVAVATGGLLANIPVLQELGGAIGSVLGAIGFQVDKLLRSLGAGGLVDLIYGFSTALYEAEGAAGAFVAIGGTLATIISGIVGTKIVVWVGKLAMGLTSLSATWASLTGALATAKAALLTIGSALAGLVSLPALIVAGIVALIAVFATDFMGIRTKVLNVLGDVWEALTGFVDDLPQIAEDVATEAANIATNIADNIVDFSIDLAGKVSSAVSDAVDWVINEGPGKLAEIASNIADGIVDFSLDFVDLIKDGVDAALSWLEGGVDVITGLGQAVGNMFIDAINDTIPNKISISIPEIDIPHGPTIGGDTVSADLPDNPVPKLQEGGLIESEGMAWLHPGEMVVPAADVDQGEDAQSRSSDFMPSQNINANFSIDGRRITEQTGRYGRDGTARRGI